jgi:peroxiredoxin Q/BCP
MTELKINDTAPEFKANSTIGEISLDKFKNKNIVLYFYPKDMTPGCTIQAQDFSELYGEFQKLDTIVIGVNKDDLDSHKQFCKKENIPYPLLLDREGKICEMYGVFKEKSMFGKTLMGINRSTFLIDKNKKIAKIWRSVKPEGHAQKVLEVIRQMKD